MWLRFSFPQVGSRDSGDLREANPETLFCRKGLIGQYKLPCWPVNLIDIGHLPPNLC